MDTQRLVIENQKLVFHITKKHLAYYDEDLIQEGYIGLVKAAKAFDPQKGIPFSSFAGHCILNQMYMALRPRKRMQREFLTLDAPIGEDRYTTLGETLVDFENQIDEACTSVELEKFMSRLSCQNKRILQLLLEGKKLKEVAECLHVTPGYVSRLRKQLAEKARQHLTEGKMVSK